MPIIESPTVLKPPLKIERGWRDARRRRDVLVCWQLDRFGLNLRHLITLLDDLQALGIALVTLGEGIDTTTPAGRLQVHVPSAINQFERESTVS